VAYRQRSNSSIQPSQPNQPGERPGLVGAPGYRELGEDMRSAVETSEAKVRIANFTPQNRCCSETQANTTLRTGKALIGRDLGFSSSTDFSYLKLHFAHMDLYIGLNRDLRGQLIMIFILRASKGETLKYVWTILDIRCRTTISRGFGDIGVAFCCISFALQL
jgi:hypothetical protein